MKPLAMISINRKWTQNLNYELNYWWHLYFLFWIFIFVLLYSGMQEAKLYYSRIDKTNRWIYIGLYLNLNIWIGFFLVLQTTLIFKFCLRIEITIHKSIASLKFNKSAQTPVVRILDILSANLYLFVKCCP